MYGIYVENDVLKMTVTHPSTATSVAASTATTATYTEPLSNRVWLELNPDWKCFKGRAKKAYKVDFDESGWTSLDLPHTWNNLDGQDGGNDYYRGVGWYRKHYSLPDDYVGRKFYLEFSGGNLVTYVWVNGRYLGQHQGGYGTFRFDATPHINVGEENIIAVKVKNSYNPFIAPLSGDFTFCGGSYRDVRLLVTDPLHIQTLDFGGPGVYLTQTNVSSASADLSILTKVQNNYSSVQNATIRTSIVDRDNTVVQVLEDNLTIAANSSDEVVQTSTIANPHLWNGKQDPYLYKVYVELSSGTSTKDLVVQPLGFRSFTIDPDTGFHLNGQYLDLYGVNLHEDRLDKGRAISNADRDEDFQLIEELGGTAVRLAHYQHADYNYSICDRNGMIVWTEIPLINRISLLEWVLSSEAFANNAKQQLTELIRQNYNHPSIAFWGIGNEQRLNNDETNDLLEELAQLVASEDPNRLSTYAHCCSSDTGELTNHTDIIGYNKYFGWYYFQRDDFAEWADSLHDLEPLRKIGVSEFGAGGSINQHTDNPRKPLVPFGPNHPEEYLSVFHEAHWLAMKTRPFLWGKFIWVMFDFASDSRNEGDTAGRNDKGLVTIDRLVKKDAFFWYKANWRSWSEPDGKVVYITSRRFNPRPNATIDIKVYSNADEVELRLNGSSLGTKTNSDRLFIWQDVRLASGSNAVEAIGRKDGATLQDTVTWTVS